MKDASQNPQVAAQLMNPEQKHKLEESLHKDYAHLREEVADKQPELLSLEKARENKLKLFELNDRNVKK
jgi:5-methyltetrahydrofolate--homocysteine methyltransferase